MKGIECPSCHGRCDPGEMIGGVCLECREEERQQIIRKRSVAQIMSSPCYQMEMQLEAMK
ncbi:hypothetical protein [Suilimivivens sp.]|jgi:hypothetical protein|uniref:hypothetical protein n=1 Tax=Suilimivivens sp. TaxID=2981669 RepID=UPI00307A78B4